jgi:ferredoxin--NADP+ reductase
MLIMTEEMAAVCDELQFSTDDGSYGHHGLITEPLRAVLAREQVDEVVAVGPVPMMAAAVQVATAFKVPVVVSLNALMIDGTGMCGGCRVTVGGVTKFCCVDGPTFDGAAVDFHEILMRQRYYRDQETEALHRCKLEEAGK